MAARTAAAAASSLAELEEALKRFDGCGLKRTAKNLCFARGNPAAQVMLIGEAPGRDEDLSGLPFVGRAGQLLDRMLAAIGLTEADVYITNIVYWRPPGNRTPSHEEVLACRPFLERQIDLVAPKLLVLLGGAAAKQLLGLEDGIMKLRGKWRRYETASIAIPTIGTLHPAYLLRNPLAKRLAWRDLLLIRAALEESHTALETALVAQ
jgi:DNA polymerase